MPYRLALCFQGVRFSAEPGFPECYLLTLQGAALALQGQTRRVTSRGRGVSLVARRDGDVWAVGDGGEWKSFLVLRKAVGSIVANESLRSTRGMSPEELVCRLAVPRGLLT